jgi:glycosyltransferase involved in cell wall biosynthesis
MTTRGLARPVLFVASRSDIAGGENYLLSVLRHIDRQRFPPLVVLPGEGPFQVALHGLGVECHVLPVNHGWLTPPEEWYRFLSAMGPRVRRLADLIRHREVALVHTNSNVVLDGALAARLAGVHHLYMAHIEFQPHMAVYQRAPLDPATFAWAMAELSTRIVAVSASVAGTLMPPLPPGRVAVIHNGLEIAALDETLRAVDRGLRSELGLAPTATLVTGVGRIHTDKGFDLLVEAAAAITPTRPDVHFLIAGAADDTAFLARLQDRTQALGLADRIHFLGRRADVPRLLANSDVFVLSSRREGHPFALLEAMACGCAAVATRCGGVDETIADGATGLVVGVDDVPGLAGAIARLVDEPTLRQRLAEAAGRDVRARFDARSSVRALQEVYEGMLRTPAPAPGSPAVDLLIQAAGEIGHLGTQLTVVEERLRQVEHLAAAIRGNPIYRRLRGLASALTGRR